MKLIEQIRGLSGFRYALRHFLAASESISRDAGITQQQYQTLLAIKASDAGQLSIADLAEQLLLTHHAAVQMMDRIAKAGLAERHPSERDGRIVFVRLTRKGDKLIERLAARHLDEMLRQEPQLRRSLNMLKRLGG
ncbi:MAG TPA: MarR family transcriptional regulator [Caulobacteraceae bacterium]|nr:MarR family transcriptional regulator [Caulobacteraceae bacterium]